MSYSKCTGCEYLVVMYEDDEFPFRWCNKKMMSASKVESC